METYLFWLAVFAVILNVVQCRKARKDKSALEDERDYVGYTRSRIIELNLINDSHQPRLAALNWICQNPCGRTTRRFLKFASTNVNGVDGALKEFPAEIRGGS